VDEVATALAEFDAVWDALTPRKQVKAIGLLIEKVDFDGASCQVEISFHSTRIKSPGEVLPNHEETAA
jgi:site-specific DNA recombinase